MVAEKRATQTALLIMTCADANNGYHSQLAARWRPPDVYSGLRKEESSLGVSEKLSARSLHDAGTQRRFSNRLCSLRARVVLVLVQVEILTHLHFQLSRIKEGLTHR